MKCYICFENYTNKCGIICNQCIKSCCGDCYMKQFIFELKNPKCGLCRYQDKDIKYSAFEAALYCGFGSYECYEFETEFIKRLKIK